MNCYVLYIHKGVEGGCCVHIQKIVPFKRIKPANHPDYGARIGVLSLKLKHAPSSVPVLFFSSTLVRLTFTSHSPAAFDSDCGASVCHHMVRFGGGHQPYTLPLSDKNHIDGSGGRHARVTAAASAGSRTRIHIKMTILAI